MRPDRCPHCDYDARGNSGWKCPECGEDVRSLPHASFRKYAIGGLAASALATILCVALRVCAADYYLVLALAMMFVFVVALLLTLLLLLNGIRRRQDGQDSLIEWGSDAMIVFSAWSLFGLSHLALRNSSFFSVF